MRHDIPLAAAAAITLLCVGTMVGSIGPVATATAQTAAPASAPEQSPRPRATGYLGAERVPDHLVFLPPPPAVDSPAGVADVMIFHATRELEGSARWALATSDNQLGSSKVLADFACAMGVDLGTAETPALTKVLARAGADLFPMVGAAKDHYARPRPFVTEKGPICVDVTPAFAASGSYPSGHSASAWLHALLLAELDPDNAAAIVARGRVFGESRVVCGMHYPSDVEGGRTTTTALVAALHGNAEFEADMAAARAEVAKARTAAKKPDAASCPADGALAPPY